ncbi:MAG: DUF5996 family protein [Acidimicrobiales bacterium]
MTQRWPALPYEQWRESCDTLHAHSQLLGKLAIALAPPQPELGHAALRLTGRGWETAPLPAPDDSGAFVVTLDLRVHAAVIEHSDGRVQRVALTPHRPVGDVTKDVIGAVQRLVGPVDLALDPQEVPWTVPLDEDYDHHTYEPVHVATYFAAATRAALVLADVRAPYRGRSTPVNAWWGSFDLAVSLFSGRTADPPSASFIGRNSADAQQIEVGWWPGDARYPRPAFFGFAVPSPEGFARATLSPPQAHWSRELGEFILNWDDVIAASDPHDTARSFGRSLLGHACRVCEWDAMLTDSASGAIAPVR